MTSIGPTASERNGLPWSRDELLLAINLYLRLPFGHIDRGNAGVRKLAAELGRSANSVAWKLANFAHLDPSLERGGASHVSRLDRQVWEEFLADWEGLIDESEKRWTERMTGESPTAPDSGVDAVECHTETQEWLRIRTKQGFFRQMVCSAYNSRCCVTGLAIPELLVAGHIVPWSVDVRNRLNPRNGLCLNVLHHSAFDAGLISISEEACVIVSPSLSGTEAQPAACDLILRYEGRPVAMPARFRPDASLLAHHREHVFRRT